MSFLMPKAPKSSSTSENLNNKLITSQYGGTMNQGVGAGNFLSQLLGVTPAGTGAGSAPAGYQNFLQMAGYAPAMRQLSQNITGQGAASGTLRSGATAGALQTRGAELNNNFFNNYLQQLTNLSGQGLQAGGLVSNAGQRSTSTSTGGGPSTLGAIGSAVGGIASIFSDRRLKHRIRRVGQFADGLGIYIFSYLGSRQRVRGVMADEVAALRPWALGPKIAGYATVNYGAL